MNKTAPLFLIGMLSLLAGRTELFAQGTAFTYQGRLDDRGAPAAGSYDFIFSLTDTRNADNYIGTGITNDAVDVTNGLFTALLDFGPAFDGNGRWLEISVRTNGATTYTTLAPRQQLTPTPYAIMASNALTAATITGPVPSWSLSGSYTGPVAFSNASNVFGGIFNGNGSGLTNLQFPGSLQTITIDNGLTASNQYTFGNRLAAPLTAFPVAAMFPYTNGVQMALDLMPSAGAVDYFGNGVAWIDLCNTNCLTSQPATLKTLRLQENSSGDCVVGSMGFNGAAGGNVNIMVNGITIATAIASGINVSGNVNPSGGVHNLGYSFGNGAWGTGYITTLKTSNVFGFGNITTSGKVFATNGIVSYATNNAVTIGSTGWTNNTGTGYVVYLSAASSLSLFDNAGVNIFNGQTIAALTPILVQNNGYFTGTAITAVGEHAQP